MNYVNHNNLKLTFLNLSWNSFFINLFIIFFYKFFYVYIYKCLKIYRLNIVKKAKKDYKKKLAKYIKINNMVVNFRRLKTKACSGSKKIL